MKVSDKAEFFENWKKLMQKMEGVLSSAYVDDNGKSFNGELTEAVEMLNSLGYYSRPLPVGAVISYMGLAAKVISDDGGDAIKVQFLDRFPETWHWTSNGVTCKIVSM